MDVITALILQITWLIENQTRIAFLAFLRTQLTNLPTTSAVHNMSRWQVLMQ